MDNLPRSRLPIIPTVQTIHAEARKVRKEGHFGILALRLAILIQVQKVQKRSEGSGEKKTFWIRWGG